jgi:hypothetical protein
MSQPGVHSTMNRLRPSNPTERAPETYIGTLNRSEIMRRLDRGELLRNARKLSNGHWDLQPASYDLSAGIAYNAPGKLDRGISYKAVSEQRRNERSWRHSETTTVPSSKPR